MSKPKKRDYRMLTEIRKCPRCGTDVIVRRTTVERLLEIDLYCSTCFDDYIDEWERRSSHLYQDVMCHMDSEITLGEKG